MDGNETDAGTILLVDDNPDIQTVISLSLEHFGYEVVCANNGEEAIKAADSCRPQIAIIDLGLPDMDGIEVGTRIRKIATNGDEILLILFSGSHDNTIQKRAEAEGFQAFIIKPVRINALIEQIQRIKSEAS